MRVYVGERDPESGLARVWIIQEQPRLNVAEIVELIAEIRSISSSVPLSGSADAEERRRADVLARKERLFARIEQAVDAPRPTEVVCHESDGFGWSGEPGGDALAASVLRCETGEDPPASVHTRFRQDVLDRQHDRWSLRLPSTAVWTWIELNRELVERELFQQAPLDNGAAWAVTDGASEAAASEAAGRSEAAASEVVRACEEAWRAIRDEHPELPDAVVILGSGVERGRLVKLGHWWAGRWIADGALRGEVLLAGEALHLKPEEVFEVLLHEAAHGLNAARGIKDTSRDGRYHNARFAAAAREVGLHVEAMPQHGLARTSLTPAARETYAATIERFAHVMRIARQIDARTRRGQERDGRDAGTEREQERERPGRVLAECGCGRKMRIARSVLAAGPIVCGLCGAEFESPDVERTHGHSEVADRSFVERQSAEAASPAAAAPPVEQSDDHAAVARWYERFGTCEETQMPAADDGEAARRDALARALLTAGGTSQGPSADIAGLDLAAGERVIATATDEPTGLSLKTPGTVTADDLRTQIADIDAATLGRLRVGVQDTVTRLLRHDYVEPAPSPDIDPERPAIELSLAPDPPGAGA